MAEAANIAAGKLPPNEIAVFSLQLSLVLRAGMPLYEGIAVIAAREAGTAGEPVKLSGRLERVISQAGAEVVAGRSLHDALERTGAFPEYMLKMVNIGEQTGKLDTVLESLSRYYERDGYLKNRIRGALVYPVFLFVIMSAVIVLLVGSVFPIFEEMLAGIGGELSGSAKAASAFSSGILAGRYTMVLMLALTAILILVFFMAKTPGGRGMIDKIVNAFPATGRIAAKVAASRFSAALAMTMSSGMDSGAALSLAAGVVGSPALREKFELCRGQVNQGVALDKAIGGTGLFSDMFVKLVEIGQKTGTTDEVMEKIAEIYEEEADTSIGNATSLVEPILVGVLSVIMGVILISVMLPLVSIMSGIS